MTWYKHEQDEKVERRRGPRPTLPMPEKSLWKRMRLYLEDRRLPFVQARKNGWYPTSYLDGFDRIVIPCTNTEGLAYYQARAMDSYALPRYHSPAASREDSIVICSPFPATQIHGTVVVEGPMDALAATDYGYRGIALMGNQPNAQVLDHLSRVVSLFPPAIIIPDQDHPEMGPFLLGFFTSQGMVAEVRMPDKKDFAELHPAARKRLLNA